MKSKAGGAKEQKMNVVASSEKKKVQKENKTIATKWAVVILPLLLLGHLYFFYSIQVEYETQYYEKNYENVKSHLNTWIPIFFVSMFLEMMYYYFANQRVYRTNDSISSLSLGTFSVVMGGLVVKILHIEMYKKIWFNYGMYLRKEYLPEIFQNALFSWWVMFFGVEFCYYWVHRTGHTWSLGWAGHSIHHSSEEYNLSTALRQSTFHQWINWAYYLPLAFLFDPAAFILQNEFNLLYQFWIHTEMVGKLGPLEYFLNTPSQHRVHHGTNSYCIDVNYGGTLCIFDRLFGTFAEERDDEEIRYGVTTQIATFSPVAANLIPLYDIWGKLQYCRNIKDVALVFWHGPAYFPKAAPPPPTKPLGDKYDPMIHSVSLTIFLAFSAIMSILSAQLFLELFKNADFHSQPYFYYYYLCSLLASCFSVYSFASAFDKKPSSASSIRISAFLLCLVYLLLITKCHPFDDWQYEVASYVVLGVFFVSTLFFASKYSSSLETKKKKVQ